MTQADQIRAIADKIGDSPSASDDVLVILGGIAQFLSLRYGPRTAAETFYSYADELSTAAPREWRL